MGGIDALYLKTDADEAVLAALRAQVLPGHPRALQVARLGPWIQVLGIDEFAAQDNLNALTTTLACDGVTVHANTIVDDYAVHLASQGTPIRRLCYGPDEDDSCRWLQVEGTPQAWEAPWISDEALKDHEALHEEEDPVARRIVQTGVLELGAFFPSIGGWDLADAVAAIGIEGYGQPDRWTPITTLTPPSLWSRITGWFRGN